MSLTSTSVSTECAAAGEVKLRDVCEVFRCSVCRTAPPQPPVYSCRLGHAACNGCRRDGRNQCSDCKEPLSDRKLPLEEIVLPALYNEPSGLISLNVDEQKEEATETSKGDLELLRSTVSKDCHVQMLTGGRTVQCPFPCPVRVTAPGLYRHFGFQHPEVFVGMLCKNQPFTVNVPQELVAGLNGQSHTRCVYIFVVDIGDEEQREDERLTALYSINAAELLNISHSMRYMLRQQKYLAMLTVGRCVETDAHNAWVTALYDFSPVRYTLRYSCGTNCVSYQGRPNSLHESAKPRRDCLLLPSTLLRSNYPSDGLELTVVFHLDLPFPQGYQSDQEPEVEHERLVCDL